MTREEKKKAIDALKISAPVMVVTQEKFNDYIQTLNKVMNWLEQEPCEDAISRKAAIDAMVKIEQDDIKQYGCSIPEGFNSDPAVEALNNLPSVIPQLKTGHWVKTPKAVMGEGYMWYCDKCEHQVYQDSSKSYPSEKYCPNCGTRMVEEQESEDKG